MNDTNIIAGRMLNLFTDSGRLSSSDIHAKLGATVSLVTVKRYVADLTKAGILTRLGGGRSTTYSLTKKGILLRPIDVDIYLATDQTKRTARKQYSHELFSEPFVPLFRDDELARLTDATDGFQQKARENQDVHERELQRFIIDMSWKSARIEGNTYSLLDTEQLLTHGIKSRKNTEFETQMILNQKAAFDFLYEQRSTRQGTLSVASIEKVHEYITQDLGVPRNMRRTFVGITGTEYRPLGNQFQIREALESLLMYVSRTENVYEKALLLTLGISYIQPFADGNKRTSRMMANAVLLAAGYAPVSYRSVDENDYKAVTLVFYEQNSIQPFKKLFMEQYIYSAGNYNIAEPQKKL